MQPQFVPPWKRVDQQQTGLKHHESLDLQVYSLELWFHQSKHTHTRAHRWRGEKAKGAKAGHTADISCYAQHAITIYQL